MPQALAARVMLKRRGIRSALHFGAGRNKANSSDKEFVAHAWLNAADIEVTGYPVGPAFSEVGCFV